jgi:DNA-binding GntR family transcriptional regulator
MPVREALRLLEAERLVAVSPHRGATVLQVSSDELEEIYVMRAALEQLAARVAVERMGPDTKAALRAQFESMAAAAADENLDTFSVEDRAFHRQLYAAAGRPGLYARILDLSQSSLRATNLAYGIWRPLVLGLEAHRPILEAIEAGDSDEASRLTFEHVTEGAARILGAVRAWEERQALEATS